MLTCKARSKLIIKIDRFESVSTPKSSSRQLPIRLWSKCQCRRQSNLLILHFLTKKSLKVAKQTKATQILQDKLTSITRSRVEKEISQVDVIQCGPIHVGLILQSGHGLCCLGLDLWKMKKDDLQARLRTLTAPKMFRSCQDRPDLLLISN